MITIIRPTLLLYLCDLLPQLLQTKKKKQQRIDKQCDLRELTRLNISVHFLTQFSAFDLSLLKY